MHHVVFVRTLLARVSFNPSALIPRFDVKRYPFQAPLTNNKGTLMLYALRVAFVLSSHLDPARLCMVCVFPGHDAFGYRPRNFVKIPPIRSTACKGAQHKARLRAGCECFTAVPAVENHWHHHTRPSMALDHAGARW